MSARLRSPGRWAIGLTIAAGLALTIIGLRFLIVPEQAARFFGLADPPALFDLHRVIALRDLWLGLLLMALALLREWRALAAALGLGAAVCIGDALIVFQSSARPAALAFHLASGVYCAAVAAACWRLSPADRRT